MMTDRDKWQQAEHDLRQVMAEFEECQRVRDHYRDALATVWSALGVDARLAIEEEFDEAGLWARKAQDAARNAD